jgi:hypothetical protein
MPTQNAEVSWKKAVRKMDIFLQPQEKTDAHDAVLELKHQFAKGQDAHNAALGTSSYHDFALSIGTIFCLAGVRPLILPVNSLHRALYPRYLEDILRRQDIWKSRDNVLGSEWKNVQPKDKLLRSYFSGDGPKELRPSEAWRLVFASLARANQKSYECLGVWDA